MKIQLPDTLLLLLGIILVFCGLTWIIPAGEFDRTQVDGRTVVVPDSYHEVAPEQAMLTDFLLAPINGFIESAQIIVFVLIIAGAFGIINASGAIAAGLRAMVKWSQSKNRKVWVIPVLTALFSLAGATFGMSEEVLVFVLITLPMAHSLGYDTFIGVGIPFLGAGAGFAGAFLNPFTVGIAQGIAELSPFSGWEYRIIVWVFFTLATIVFLMYYGRKITRDPSLKFMTKLGKDDSSNSDYTKRHQWIMRTFALSLVALIVGVNRWDWYISEISALFLVLGFVTAIVGGLKRQAAIEAFVLGASEMIKVCFVIALAKAVILVSTDGKIIDTILYSMTNYLDGFPKEMAVQCMFYMQTVLNFFLPSGSGQAALTMPIMAPLGDLIGISRQTSVLAFQFGDGISNMIIPTSGVTMGVLALAEIPFGKWIKWVWPYIVTLFVLAMIFLLPPVLYFNY